MATFQIPTKNEVSANNQAIFDNLNKGIGFVPNLYAIMAYSDTALGQYLEFQGGKSSLSKKEKEVINLVVSQVNDCQYCLAAHTAIGKMNGFTEEQTLELRQGYASWDSKLDALAKFTHAVSESKGRISENLIEDFLNAGYTKGSIVDVIATIGDKIIMNYLHNLTKIAVDFPAAPELAHV